METHFNLLGQSVSQNHKSWILLTQGISYIIVFYNSKYEPKRFQQILLIKLLYKYGIFQKD